jgi:hypothetical protein
MTKPSVEEIARRLEMIARLHSVMLDIEDDRRISHVKDTWAWRARDRLLELEAEIIAEAELKVPRQLSLELIRANVAGLMLETDWRHKKTGNVYMVVGGCRIEATNKLGILYARDGVVWCRPSEEFLDGRFEALT